MARKKSAAQLDREINSSLSKRRGTLEVLGAYTIDLDRRGALVRQPVDVKTPGDYGADPLGDGTFRMVPSGDVVSSEEKERRLARFRRR